MSEIGNLLAEAGEKIRKEAYAAGWADCVAAIVASVEKVAPPDAPVVEVGRVRATKPIKTTDGPKMGTTPYYVLQAVTNRPGMTGAEIVSAVVDAGHRVSEAHIRTALSRLGAREMIVNRYKKWFPA